MRFGGLQKTTLIDFPGLVAATVFTAGCNLACPWCHNGPLVAPGADGTLEEEDLFAFLQKRAKVLDGVVISGGEPTLQPDLESLILRIRGLGLKVKLDTNGTRPEILERLLKKNILDYVALDIKAVPERYEAVAGCPVSASKLTKSIELLRCQAPDFEFRLTLVPGLHRLEDMAPYGRFLKKGPLYLQNFRPISTAYSSLYRQGKVFLPDQVQEFASVLRKHMEGPVVIR